MHIVGVFVTVFLCCIVNIVCFKKWKIGKKWKEISINNVMLLNKKEWFCFFVMMAVTECCGAILVIYHHNSFVQDFRRICLLCLLWPIAWNDYKEQIIPNLFLKIGCYYWVIWILISLFTDRNGLLMEIIRSLFAVFMITIICIICTLIIKNCMGMGDIKLLMVMGLLQGTTGLISAVTVSLFLSFFVCLFYLISKKKGRKDSIAFAPLILIGTTISILLKGV